MVRTNSKGEWEIADTRDPAVIAEGQKLDPTQTLFGHQMIRLAESVPLQVNGKEVPNGHAVALHPGDRILTGTAELQFQLPGPKPWDAELAKHSGRNAVNQKLSAAKTFADVKRAVAESGVPGSDKVQGDIDVCLDGKMPVSALPQALREPMLRAMELQNQDLAKGLPKGYKPALNRDAYRGGVDPREQRFHTLKAAVLFAQEFRMAGNFKELRAAIENTPLENPEGMDKKALLSYLDRFEKGQIGIQDIPLGLGLRQKFRDLWEAKNLNLMEGGPNSGKLVDPAAVAAVENLDSRANDIYAELGRIGPVKGSAKTYSVVELRELVYEVLERGKPLEQLPTNKGVRAMVENYMRMAMAEARAALKSNLDFRKNFFTGEDFKERNFNKKEKDPGYVESLQAKYRFIRMYLNQKAGKPIYGEPSPREMIALSAFVRDKLGQKSLGKYSEFQAVIRDQLGRLTPEIQAALAGADPETRALVVEAYFGASRHRQVEDVSQALRIATFLGKIDFHREIGVTADTSGDVVKVNLTLGDVAHVSPEDSHLYFLLHTHPNDYSSPGGMGSMGINQTIALGQGLAGKSTMNVLFSTTDIRIYARQAQDVFTLTTYSKADVSAFYDKDQRIYRNWVQHTGGVSQAEVILGADGKPKSIRIQYGLYPKPIDLKKGVRLLDGFLTQGDAGHTYSAEQLRRMSRELGIPVTVEQVDPAVIEAKMPFGKR